MEVCNPKGGRTATPAFLAMLMMMMIMMLLNAYCCGASVLVKSNTSFRCSEGRLDECLIEEDLELELEFLMNPYVSRILANGKSQPNSSDPDKPIYPEPCGSPGDPPGYSSCTSNSQQGNHHQCVRNHVQDRCQPSQP
ncbi:hypothetical protein I3760_03G114500 [Carya illinoinensis]|nr:hypothetical protein I3760_03G114500 [Carya illinoinensis]